MEWQDTIRETGFGGNFMIEFDKDKITKTDYFVSPMALRGLLYFTINAGCFFLLVPDERYLAEMRTGEYAVVSRGRWDEKKMGPVDQDLKRYDGLEIMFEDNSAAPFALQLGYTQVGPFPDRTFENRRLKLSVYLRAGLALELPAYYRKISYVPCLKKYKGKL